MVPTVNPGSEANDPISVNLDLEVMNQLLDLDDGELGLLEEMLGLYTDDGVLNSIGVIGFDEQTQVICEMTNAASKDAVQASIDSLQAGGGTHSVLDNVKTAPASAPAKPGK